MPTLLARLLTLAGIRYTHAHIARICAHDDGSLPFFRYALAAFRTESLAVELPHSANSNCYFTKSK